MQTPDLEKIKQIIEHVGDTEVMPRFNNLSVSDVYTKDSPEDLVTIADTESEKKLTTLLKDALPNSVVVGEEATFQDPSLLDLLTTQNPVWIIDPIDGTSNFAYGKPEIGIVVALAYKGETVAGWLYHPVKRAIIMGEKGAGAFLNKKRLNTAKITDFDRMNGVVGRNVGFKDPKLPKPVWWGSAAYSYMLLTTGCVHYSAFRTGQIKPWDHAAGVLLHTESGGYTAYVDGTSYTPFMGRKNLISAPNVEAWKYLQSNIQSKNVS